MELVDMDLSLDEEAALDPQTAAALQAARAVRNRELTSSFGLEVVGSSHGLEEAEQEAMPERQFKQARARRTRAPPLSNRAVRTGRPACSPSSQLQNAQMRTVLAAP
eukprot:4480386-Prymnesium_polylepis.1